MLPIQQLQELIQGKKVAFIGAGVSHKRWSRSATRKRAWTTSVTTPTRCAA